MIFTCPSRATPMLLAILCPAGESLGAFQWHLASASQGGPTGVGMSIESGVPESEAGRPFPWLFPAKRAAWVKPFFPIACPQVLVTAASPGPLGSQLWPARDPEPSWLISLSPAHSFVNVPSIKLTISSTYATYAMRFLPGGSQIPPFTAHPRI